MSVESIKTRAKKKKPTSPWHKRYRVLIIIMVAFLLMIAAYATVTSVQYHNEASDARLKMETYLEDKYGKDFVVEKPQLTGSGFAVPGSWRAEAYPVNDRGTIFETGKAQNSDHYFDGYSGAVWAKEERPQVLAFLKTLYGERIPEFGLKAHIITSAKPDPIRGGVPSVNEAMTRYKDNFFYSLSIRLIVSHPLSESDFNEHLAKMKQIVDFVHTKGIASPSVTYAINVSDRSMGYLCHLYKDELADKNKVDSCLKSKRERVW